MTMEKTFNAQEAEERLYDAWEQGGCFEAGVGAKPGAETFCIVIPPPNVTGSLHMGHAFNNTLQDILTRWKRMQGFDTLWQPGLDHAGIATQMVVERQLAANGEPGRRDMGREAFVQRIWDWKAESGGTIINQLKRLGASCDWSRERFTMDEGLSRAVLQTFVALYNEGLIYKGKRLVNWDPHFETAISDLEVENREVDGHMWHFKYPLAVNPETGERETYEYIEKDDDGTVTLRETRDYISIATTRPETMLGDGAVAVHTDDERYAPIVGKLCEIPVGPKEHRRLIPIITDEYPDPAFGSGAVKITGAHDFNDYAVAKRNGIPLYNLMDSKAQMRTDGLVYKNSANIAGAIAWGERDASDVAEINLVPEELRGLDRYEARKQVIEAISAEGLAVMETITVKDADGNETAETRPYVESKKIMQPFGDRSNVVIEPYLTDQWFVNAEELAKDALAAAHDGRTQILPEHNTKVYDHWMENIEPWCISRQLWWGHQVPVWYGPERTITKEVNATKENLKISMQNAAAHDGRTQILPEHNTKVYDHWMENIEPWCISRQLWWGHQVPVWYDADGAAYCAMSEEDAIAQAGGKALTRDPDVLDTWFSSALWPFSTLGWPDETDELAKYYKTDVLITGFDILFFWVARMMMMGLKLRDEVPFHTVYIHALVRDAKGQKMSKSKGNVLDPLELIDQYGADAVRFTLTSMAALGRDLKLSTSRVEGYRNFGTKLWNAARFCQMNDCQRDPAFDPRAVKQTVNAWIIGETARLRETVDTALAAYRFNDYAAAVYSHVWNVFCDWYVEFAKPLFTGDDAAAKAETRATAAWALDEIVTLLHPVMPFVTEELWRVTGGEGPLMLRQWPGYSAADLADADADAEMDWVIRVIDGVRSVRAEMNVAPSAKIEMILTGHNTDVAYRLLRNAPLITRLARLSQAAVAETAPDGCVTVALDDCAINLPLKGVVDVAAERARLEKTHAKLAKEVGGLKGKLSNAKFLAKAPEDVVAEQRERLAGAEAETARVAAALERLAALS